ncbi:archaetidylserine decarboxylase [Zwartia hollandica]|jgi:phosphatidylserine decarboxylase|nr:archaetidylserine decarboxylase [Zwartia hollandica]
MMTFSKQVRNIVLNEDINFLLTNRIPRKAVTHFMGWFSKLRNRWVSRLSISVWRVFTDLDLSDAKKQQFDSLHECFTRELRDGARVIDRNPEVFVSPCDAIVGECGYVVDGQVFQAKGFPYAIEELFGRSEDVSAWRDGCYVTLRLTSAMYHRFHAPHDGVLRRVVYMSGDTWNVNPIALKRVEKLFCKNERAMLAMNVGAGEYAVALVPVAAILVASIRLHALDTIFGASYQGETTMLCEHRFEKGQELGWFEHGSTIIVFAPKGFSLSPGIMSGARLRMGQPLMNMPQEGIAHHNGAMSAQGGL